ncbi:hypothetical protein [Alkalihalobacillus pseudalcaliphilus]|uniref:hypothetical protein n=1 Tax=Alkalihalobacillus pseudalcaliphilus TaxID=79884 RepID=UPI00064D8B77|nr:hypothetical protein [Alkalihalobacillus pseudalcaliphilus]KMK75072.1 hypothetical protein AB990_16555 [Alkalihalobacillus pseudalcaliphilus]
MRQKREWSEIREKGPIIYILKDGVLGWGIPTAILYFFFIRILDNGFAFSQYFSEGWVWELMMALIIFPLTGLLFGWLMWILGERKYKRGKV